MTQAPLIYVVTLLCDPSFPALADRHLAHASEALPNPQAPIWLDKGIAADILFAPDSEIDGRGLAQKLREKIADPQIDVIVQPVETRRKKLLLLEMDRVLLRQSTADDIAAIINAAPQLADLRAKHAAGSLSHAEATKAFSALLQTRTTECLQQVLSKRMQMRSGAKVLVDTMKANGGAVVLATYGFSCFAGPVAQKAGIEIAAANRLLIEGRQIGELAEPVLDPDAKAAFLDQVLAARSVPPTDMMIVTADPADLALFSKGSRAMAFHADAAVMAAADADIAQGDLSALLYVQGYAKEAFVTEQRRDLDASDWKRKYGAYEKAHERTRF